METLVAAEGEPVFVIRDDPPRWWRRRRPRAVVASVAAAAVVSLAAWVVVAQVIPTMRVARRVACLQNLKRVGLALNEYHDARQCFPRPAVTDSDGKPLLSWRVEILPRLGYQKLYDEFRKDEPWDGPHNRKLVARIPPVFVCPGTSGASTGETGYRVVVGPKTELGSLNTMFEPGRGVDVREVVDGTSGTLMVVESADLVPWTKPDEFQWAKGEPLPRFGSPHDGGFNALFGDGSARFLRATLPPAMLQALITINGGEVISGGDS